jgi:cytochrome P450
LIRTPHVSTNLDPRHWENPDEFNPDRYLSAPASNKVDKSRARELGFATCPFESTPFHVKDGRKAEVTNSAFGAVYGVVAGNALPVCDYAGYAPFGFGYRRCAGELFTINIFKDFFRKVWKEKIIFRKLKGTPKRIPVGAGVMTDDIGFSRQRA